MKIHPHTWHNDLMWKPNLGKNTNNMLLISHSSKVIPYERPNLLKVITHTVKCDPVKGFYHPIESGPCYRTLGHSLGMPHC